MKKPVPRCRKAIPGMPYMLFHGVEKPVPQCGKGSSAMPYGVFCGMKKRKPMIVRDLCEVRKKPRICSRKDSSARKRRYFGITVHIYSST